MKNVSGFDLCRLLVGSRGTLGFLGDVIMRTRPRATYEQWFTTTDDPWADRARAVPTDVACSGTARRRGCCSRAIPATSPTRPSPRRSWAATHRASCRRGGRWSMRPADLASLPGTGRFVAEIGIGIVHHELPAPVAPSRRGGGRAAPQDQGAVRPDRSAEPRRDGVARCTLSARSSTRRPVRTRLDARGGRRRPRPCSGCRLQRHCALA